jgi:hypothetical protein
LPIPHNEFQVKRGERIEQCSYRPGLMTGLNVDDEMAGGDDMGGEILLRPTPVFAPAADDSAKRFGRANGCEPFSRCNHFLTLTS